MNQTYLTENPPMILDATCSVRKIWPRYASLRMDVRKEVKPDIVADAQFLPFRNGSFERIYCDPPHFIRSDARWDNMVNRLFYSVNRKMYPHAHWMNSMTYYGHFVSRKQWLAFVQNTNVEFSRCLKNEGVLEYKITDGPKRDMTTLADLDGMDKFSVIKQKITKSPFGKKPVHWLTMKPLPKSTTSHPRILETDAQSL